MSATIEPPAVGEFVGEGRFELLARLGDGGTSVVYRARDRLLDRELALKLLLPRYVGRPEREQRLINEAEYLRRLQGHAHIIEFIDSGRLRDAHDWPWLATEVLCGKVLDWVLVRGRLGAARTVKIAQQILEALRVCHAAGIVHRDITPSNVFELDDADKTVKLFDFSHAADLDGPKSAVGAPERLTGIFDVPGTLGYMGPEQVQQDPADPTMDVFGFGILLYELVTGQSPYANLNDRSAFIKAQRDGTLKPPRLHAWAYRAPEEFETLVRDCTLRDASKRPTIDTLIERLHLLEARLPGDLPASTTAWGPPPNAAPEVPEATVRMDAIGLLAEQRGEREPDPDPEVTATVDAVRVIAEQRRELELGPEPEPEPETTAIMDAQANATAKPARSAATGSAAAAVAQASVPGAIFQQEAAPVELAFARPPELRGPALQVVDSRPGLESADPGVAAPRPDPSAADDDLDPVASGRRWVWGLGGAALLLGLLTWAWFGRDDQARGQVDGDFVASGSAPADLGSESDETTDSGESPHLEPVPEVETTGGVESEVEVKPKPEAKPKPKPKPKIEHEPKPELVVSPECEDIEQKAKSAANNRDWEAVLDYTSRAKCWSSKRNRQKFEVLGYGNSGQWAKCVAAGEGSRDPEVQRRVAACKDSL